MRHELRERRLPLLCVGALAAATPALVELVVGGQKVSFTGRLHVIAVGFTSLAAAIAAVVLSVAGARRSNGRAVATAMALAVMAGLLALHGLATPGIFVGVNGVIAVTGGLTLPLGGLLLLLTTVAPPALLRRVGPPLVFGALAIAGLLALGASAIVAPDIVPQVPLPSSFSALSLLALGLMVFVQLIYHALRTFLATRRIADLAAVVGLAWLLTALVPALTMTYAELGWWLGHELELAGISVIGAVAALDLVRNRHETSAADAGFVGVGSHRSVVEA